METFLLWLKDFALAYPALKYLAVYVGTAFGGEFGPITFSFLAAQGFIKTIPLVVIAFFGAISADILWFILGRTKMAGKIFDHKHAVKTVFMITEAVRKISHGSHALAIILTKFLIGTRVVLILYIGKIDLSLRDFIKYDIVATIIWLIVVVPIGYLAGLGFTYVSHIVENIYAGIGFVLLILFGVVMIQLWLKKLFIKEGEEIAKEEGML